MNELVETLFQYFTRELQLCERNILRLSPIVASNQLDLNLFIGLGALHPLIPVARSILITNSDELAGWRLNRYEYTYLLQNLPNPAG